MSRSSLGAGYRQDYYGRSGFGKAGDGGAWGGCCRANGGAQGVAPRPSAGLIGGAAGEHALAGAGARAGARPDRRTRSTGGAPVSLRGADCGASQAQRECPAVADHRWRRPHHGGRLRGYGGRTAGLSQWSPVCRLAWLDAEAAQHSLQQWIVAVLARIGYHKTLVAIANKHARIIWALLAKGESDNRSDRRLQTQTNLPAAA